MDADFVRKWDKDKSLEKYTKRSNHFYIIMYAGYRLVWISKLQTDITLSIKESEYMGLSYTLMEVIPIIQLLKERNR